MSGGSQHNPNGRQSQLGPAWSPLQLQVASFLARAPQAHMASERGVTWHTPTPPPHLYHVPAPSPPDPLQALLQLQAMKSAGNSVFRHTATPPDLYRRTPPDVDKHLMSRHTPSPGEVKPGAPLPPADLYPHLGPGREKLRPEDLLSYARGSGGGVDLSVGARGANGAPAHPSPALSVRDAPTINSLIARAQPRHGTGRVDSLLERLAPSPHSVIVAPRHTPQPPDPNTDNEDSTDSCGAPPGSKRKRKPERTVRVPSLPPHTPPPQNPNLSPPRVTPPTDQPLENGDTHANGPETKTEPVPEQDAPDSTQSVDSTQDSVQEIVSERQKSPTPDDTVRRKTRSSSETIDDIAAMIASTNQEPIDKPRQDESEDPPVTIDKLKSVLASPDPKNEAEVKKSPVKDESEKALVESAAAPKRRSARTNTDATNVPIESPSEAKPAEVEANEGCSAEPTAASFVEVENQLEKMFAGLEEEPQTGNKAGKGRKRRKSAPTKGDLKASRRSIRSSTGDERRKPGRKPGKGRRKEAVKEYDSGSNASSSRSRGPYIQIRGPRDSPLSVSVINASGGEDEADGTHKQKGTSEFRNGLRAKGLHASTLGLRYDATTADVTWLCVFCERGPHADGLGDLFGPYTVHTDCEEYKVLDEATRRRYTSCEVWFHALCGVWAPGLVACGARLWGLDGAVWAARANRCGVCSKAGANIACSARACWSRVHVPCACAARWQLNDEDFRALCPRHA